MAKATKQETEIKTDGWKDTFSDLMNFVALLLVFLVFHVFDSDEAKYAELVASHVK